MRRTIAMLFLLTLPFLIAACGSDDQPSTESQVFDQQAQDPVAQPDTRSVVPDNTIEISVIYAPESEQFMPQIMASFNQAYAEGTHPVTGEPLIADERRIYVTGSPPQGGLSSGGVMQGIVNAAIGANVDNTLRPTMFAPSVSHWLSLANLQAGFELFDIDAAQPTAISPVVIAIWESRLDAIKETVAAQQGISPDAVEVGWEELLGVLNSPNGWQDYGVENGRRAVYYGHADPTNSSTALSTLIAEFYACAREEGYTDRRMEIAWVQDPNVQQCVREIEQLVKHYAHRTEDFLEYIAQGPDYLDFVAVEEIDMICLNTGGQQGDEVCRVPEEPLTALYPKEGTFWHEHPIAVLQADWVTPEQASASQVFIEYLLLPPQQELVMSYGFRPANPDVPLGYPFVEENGVTPEGPQTIINIPASEVLTELQDSWSLVRKQADVMLLVDVSGSMGSDGKLEQAKAAAHAFLDNTEGTSRVGLSIFSDDVEVVVPLGNFEVNEANLRAAIDRLVPDTGTSLYYALESTVNLISAEDASSRIRAVVLLSDGEDTSYDNGTIQDVTNAIRATSDAVNPVIVIPVAYGQNADIRALTSIARSSNTSVQFGDPENILKVLEVLSSYF